MISQPAFGAWRVANQMSLLVGKVPDRWVFAA